MSGLVRKEFYLLKGLGRSYALIFAFFILMALTGVYNYTFASAFAVMMLIMMPINTFSYDEAAKWDRYAAASPAGRRGIVRGKYLFTLLLGAALLALSLLVQTAFYFLGQGDGDTLGEMYLAAVCCIGAGLLLNAVMLPCIFKLGVQKGRIALLLSVGAASGAFALVAGMGGKELRAAIEPLVPVLPAAGVALLAASHFLSVRIYAAKEL